MKNTVEVLFYSVVTSLRYFYTFWKDIIERIIHEMSNAPYSYEHKKIREHPEDLKKLKDAMSKLNVSGVYTVDVEFETIGKVTLERHGLTSEEFFNMVTDNEA